MLRGTRVIIVTGSLELGGAERQALLLARHLREQEDARVECWGLGGAGRVSELCERWGICWRSIPYFGGGQAADLAGVARLAWQLRRAAPEVIIPYTWFPNVVCGVLWRLTGATTCIWQQRDAGFNLDPRRASHRLAARLTPAFVSNSGHAARYLAESFGVDPRRIETIGNGVRLEQPAQGRGAWRDRLGAEDGDFVACMVANFTVLKDHATAVAAWRLVVDALDGSGRRALLVLAGREDGTLREVEAQIADLRLSDHVLLPGAVDDIAGLLAACDLAVHCAEQEGCPNAVLEAMAAGLPVVGSDNAGMREALGDAGAPLLAPFRDAHGVAGLIAALAGNEERRKSLGEVNRRRAVGEFGVEAMCRRTVSVIVQDLSRRAGRCRE